MKKVYKTIVLVFVLLCNIAFAQRTITGNVTSAVDSLPLIGATIQVEGTTTGTTTDIDGNYTITVDNTATRLIFSYIGLKRQTVTIPTQAPTQVVSDTTQMQDTTGQAQVVQQTAAIQLNVIMQPDLNTFDEVVVTAIAIDREKRSLGYGTTTLQTEDLVRVNQASPLTALSGKVAGAQITTATGAPGGSTRVVLRGGSSFLGDNNALIIVDGVPIDNSNFGFMGPNDDVLNNQFDAGNRGSDINPQDIESVTVLKGASAVALYGQRGANGAIMITTKKGGIAPGGSGRKFMVSYSTQNSFGSPLKMPDRQDQYGQGGGNLPDYRENWSWGPKLDGSMQPWGQEVDGEQRVKPFKALPNNWNSFFDVSKSLNNNLSISGALKGTSYYLSYNNFKYNSFIPGIGYTRNSIRANVSHDFGGKLTSLVTFNYNKTQGDLLVQGQSDGAAYTQLLNIPVDISVKEQEDLDNKFNKPETYFGAYYQNPYWVIANQKNLNNVDRFNTSITLDYTPIKWLSFIGRFGSDVYTDSRIQKWRKYVYQNQGLEKNYLGRYSEDIYFVNILNADVMVRGAHTFKDKYSISALLGTNIYHNQERNTHGVTNGLAIDDLYTFENSLDRPTLSNATYIRRLAGLYFDVNFGYKNMLFVDITGRNDWSSTLPRDNRSYFYPGAAVSFVFTELMKKVNPLIISYGKIRASIAQIGRDAPVYSLRNVLVPGEITDGFQDSKIRTPFASYDGSQMPGYTVSDILRNDKLKPELSTTWEVGTELSFLKDRLNIDFTYYWKRTRNQIMEVDAPPSAGVQTQIINAGILENKGVELAVNVTPLLLKNGLKWEIYGTFTKNVSKVIDVYEGVNQLSIGGLSGMAIVLQKGQPYGSFYAITQERDPNGNPVVDEEGKPVMNTESKILGTFSPDWLGSIGTSLTFKGLRFNLLFDARVGGKFYSHTRTLLQFVGVDPLTAEFDRYKDAEYVIPNSVQRNDQGEYIPNTTPMSHQDYWTLYVSQQDFGSALLDATWVKLREISLSYSLPKKWMAKAKYITNVEFSLFANNIWMWVPKENTYVDPEVGAYGATNAQGFEYYNLPSLRSGGFGVKVDF